MTILSTPRLHRPAPSATSTLTCISWWRSSSLSLQVFFYIFKGLTLTSAYVTFSSSINMTFSILVSVFTLQNWFIFRCFWHKTGLPLSPMAASFNGLRYNEVGYLPTNNFRPLTAEYATASFYDAIGACIAMFCAISPLLGRIGFLEVFFISWVFIKLGWIGLFIICFGPNQIFVIGL